MARNIPNIVSTNPIFFLNLFMLYLLLIVVVIVDCFVIIVSIVSASHARYPVHKKAAVEEAVRQIQNLRIIPDVIHHRKPLRHVLVVYRYAPLVLPLLQAELQARLHVEHQKNLLIAVPVGNHTHTYPVQALLPHAVGNLLRQLHHVMSWLDLDELARNNGAPRRGAPEIIPCYASYRRRDYIIVAIHLAPPYLVLVTLTTLFSLSVSHLKNLSISTPYIEHLLLIDEAECSFVMGNTLASPSSISSNSSL